MLELNLSLFDVYNILIIPVKYIILVMMSRNSTTAAPNTSQPSGAGPAATPSASGLEVLGIPGGNYLREALTSCSDPLQAIEEFQVENGILLPSLRPMMPLLDLHGVKRLDFHISVMEVLLLDVRYKQISFATTVFYLKYSGSKR